MTKAFVGKIEFDSPINKENSFGAWNIAEKAHSVIDVTVRGDGSGFFEWWIESLVEYWEGGLWFEDNILTDYGGLFELPVQLLALLKEQGYDVEEHLIDN